MTGAVSDEVELLVLAELAKRVKARTEIVKAVVGSRFDEGSRETFRSPLGGEKLGMIWRSDPDPQWKVTDREALHEHLSGFDGVLETSVGIAPEDMAEALAVIGDHAPHLLTLTTRVSAEAEQAALAQSVATGEAAAPGIERIQPAGVLTVKPDKAAGDAVERLVAAGWIEWDGRPALTTGAGAA